MAYTFTRTGAQIEEIHNTVDDLPNIVSNENLISNSSFEIAGSVTNPPGSTPRSYNAGDELFQGVFAVGNLAGVTYVNGLLNGTGRLYTDIHKTNKQKDSTSHFTPSIAGSNGAPYETGATVVDNGDYWRVTFDMINTFSVKFEQGSVATRHDAVELPKFLHPLQAYDVTKVIAGETIEGLFETHYVGQLWVTKGAIWSVKSLPVVDINNLEILGAGKKDVSTFGVIYDSQGDSLIKGTDNLPALQYAIDSIKSMPVGLKGEFTGGELSIGFGGVYISESLSMENNASVSVKGVGKTKSNIFVDKSATISSIFTLTGSNNSRNEFKDLRLTTVGGSEGYIHPSASGFYSSYGANQIDIKGCWVNNLKSVYSGVASDSSIKDVTAEYCRGFVDINGGGSRDLDVSENVLYNIGNIGLPEDSQPFFRFNDVENLTLSRNRIINDTAAGPFVDGMIQLTSVLDFDIDDLKFFKNHALVGPMFNINGGRGRINNIKLPPLTDRSMRAEGCESLEIDKVTTSDEKSPQNNQGIYWTDCETVKVGILEIGRTGLSNLVINNCSNVIVDTLVLHGSSVISPGYDDSLRVTNSGSVVINNLIIKNQSNGSYDIFSDASVDSLIINNVIGTDQSRINSTAVVSIITNVVN